MTLVGEAASNAGFENPHVGIVKKFASTLNSSAKHILMRRESNRLLKEFRKIVRAHSSDRSQLGKSHLLVQIRFDVFLYALEPRIGEAATEVRGLWRCDSVPLLQVHRESVGQRFAKELAAGRASVEIGFERAKNVFDLPILYTPLIHQFHVCASVMLLQTMLEDFGLQSKKNSFHRFWKRNGVAGAAREQDCRTRSDYVAPLFAICAPTKWSRSTEMKRQEIARVLVIIYVVRTVPVALEQDAFPRRVCAGNRGHCGRKRHTLARLANPDPTLSPILQHLEFLHPWKRHFRLQGIGFRCHTFGFVTLNVSPDQRNTPQVCRKN